MQWETWSDLAERFQEGVSRQESLRVQLTPGPLWEQRKALKDLIASTCNASNSFLEFARDLRGVWLRGVQVGRGRDGLAMVVIEHQPPGMTTGAMKQALDDELAAVARSPGALVLELRAASTDAATNVVVIHEEHAGALTVQPCGRSGPVRVYAGQEIARSPKLAQALAEVVQNTAAGVREAPD